MSEAEKRKKIMGKDYNDLYEVDVYVADDFWGNDFIKAYCEYHKQMKQKYPELYPIC